MSTSGLNTEDLFSLGATHTAEREVDFIALKLVLETLEADAVDACVQSSS